MKAEFHRRVRLARLVPLAALLILAAGCAKGGKLHGKVSCDGQPVPKAQIFFLGENGQSASTTADDNGNYSISKVPVGKVRVGVKNSAQGMGDMQGQIMAKMAKNAKDGGENAQKTIDTLGKESGKGGGSFVPVPPQYGDPEKSDLAVDVKGGSQEFNIEMKN